MFKRVLVASLVAAGLASEEVLLEALEVEACDVGDEEACALSFRQLRGDKRSVTAPEAAEALAEVSDKDGTDALPEEEAGRAENPLFLQVDANSDGIIQQEELHSLLARMNISGDAVHEMYNMAMEEAESSEGLDTYEFDEAMQTWDTTCKAAKSDWFCSGETKVRCCKDGLFWKECGSYVNRDPDCRRPGYEMTCTASQSMQRGYFCSGETQVKCCKRGAYWEECGRITKSSNCRMEPPQTMTCSAQQRSYFCSGETQVKCCKRGKNWEECGRYVHHSSCLPNGGVVVDDNRRRYSSMKTCETQQRQTFCDGNTRVHCCRNGASQPWYQCSTEPNGCR